MEIESVMDYQQMQNSSHQQEIYLTADLGDVMNGTGADPREVDDSTIAVVNGYLSTALVLFTLVTNCLVCIVLLKRHMRGSPTNVLLVALSISTTLTGMWPIPVNVNFYVLGEYSEWVPCRWARAYDILIDYLPTIFHTSSIWLTVSLAVQRYVAVCHATTLAKRWCTVDNVVRASCIILVVASLSNCIRFFENRYEDVEMPSKIYPNTTVLACVSTYIPFVEVHQNVYFACYYIFRIVFINGAPCIILVILNAALINTMKTAAARRKMLLKYNRRSECRRLAESNSTTLMLVTVVGVFLLVEFPMAVFFLSLIVANTFGLDLFDSMTSSIASIVVNLLILFSYLINFFIYCAMSRQFRDTFKSLFVPGLQNLAPANEEVTVNDVLVKRGSRTCATAIG